MSKQDEVNQKSSTSTTAMDAARTAATKIAATRPQGLRCKLDWDKVEQIRQLKSEGFTNAVLAELFDVHARTIGSVIANETWKVVEQEAATTA